jgi:hypothetical protein
MVDSQELIRVRTISKKQLQQVITPNPGGSETCLWRRVLAALKNGTAKRVGWVWKDAAGELRGESGYGVYVASPFLHLVQWEEQLFLIPAPDRWTADKSDAGPQLFV